MVQYAVMDFNGTLFENRDEKPFFKGMFSDLLKAKLLRGQLRESYRLLGFKKEIEREIEEYRTSRGSVSGSLQDELRDQHEQLKVVYDTFNEKVVSDPLVTLDFVKRYTERFAKENKGKIDKRLIQLTNGLDRAILSVAYRREIWELLDAFGHENFLPEYIVANIMKTSDGDIEITEHDGGHKAITGHEAGKPKEFRLDANETNKAEFLEGVFFKLKHFQPKHTVYFGDSKSDIPCIELVTSEGGIAVTPPFVMDALNSKNPEVRKEAEEFVQLGSKHGLRVTKKLREFELALKT